MKNHSQDPHHKKDDDHKQFDEFAELMLGLVHSFDEVLKKEDPNTKLLAIELLGDIKEKFGEHLQFLMEKHNVSKKEIEEFLAHDQSALAEKVREVNKEIEKVNDRVEPAIEKTLEEAGIQKKGRRKSRKTRIIKKLY